MADLLQVGETITADGFEQKIRGGRLADLIVSEMAGDYHEATRRGRTFSAMLGATTTGVAAGNITAAAAAASTQFALWNPPGSGIVMSINKCWVGVISGTPVGGPLFHNVATIAPTIAGSAPSGNLIGGGPLALGRFQGSAAGAALTGGGALSQLRPMNIDFSAGAFASVGGSAIVMEVLDGDIVLMPNSMWVPCWQAAGTTLLNAYGVTYNEFPI